MKFYRLFLSALLACGLLVVLFASLAGILAHTASPAKAQGTFTVRYVAPSGNDAGNNCVNPNAPCATIQHAVDVADPGDEIRIAEGVYTHTFQRNGITQSVYISKSLFLRGGYTTTTWASAPPPDPRYKVVIAPMGQGRGIVITPSMAAGALPPDVRIEALEIFKGNAAGLGGGPSTDAGGGIYAVSATLVLTEVGVISSTADTGGGIYAQDTYMEMRFSRLVSNTVNAGCGGALYLGKANGAIFKDIVIRANRSRSGNGGGVCIEDSTEVSWESAELDGNDAYANGGGVWVANSSDVYFERIFAHNNRSKYGGAFHFDGSSVDLVNVLIVDNEVGAGDGTAVALYNNSDLELYHATVVRNRKKSSSAGAALDVKLGSVLTSVNTILVGHETGVQVGANAQAVMTATLWGAGMWANTNNWVNNGGTLITGTINFFDVPRFVNPMADDYHLQPTSPAVDAGVSTPVLIDADFEPRPLGPAPDLGGDEVPYKALDPNKDDRFVYTDTQGLSMTLDMPAGSVTETVKLAITKREEITEPLPSGWRLAGLAFDMDAYRPSSQDPAEGYRFQGTITVTIRYRDQDVQGVPEETLKLLFWDKEGKAWKDIAKDCETSYARFPAQNMLQVGVCHLTRFALMGINAPIRLFLPAVMR